MTTKHPASSDAGRIAARRWIASPIPWAPQDDIDARKFPDWGGEERFRKLARLVQRHCTSLGPYNRVPYPRVFAPQSHSVSP